MQENGRSLFEWVEALAPSTAALFVTILLALALHWWLVRSKYASHGHGTRNQLLLLGLTVLGLIAVVLLLPISDDFRAEILRLLGIIVSAGIALSSTTFLGNMLAGFMLRAIRNFRAGDFIQVEEHFGRVSERGLFHTEIQTEERDLTTLPNLYLVTNPVTTLRASGTIVSTTLSLGYDVPRLRIEELLLEAAGKAGLSDPFVLVQELGDFSVTYRVAGLLTDVKSLITARSRIRKEVLDSLHGGGVEIVSPTFMNTRAFPPDEEFIPRSAPVRAAVPAEDAPAPEEILFDKADEAEAVEETRRTLDTIGAEIKAVDEELRTATEEQRPELEARKMALDAEREQLAAELEEKKNNAKQEEA